MFLTSQMTSLTKVTIEMFGYSEFIVGRPRSVIIKISKQ